MKHNKKNGRQLAREYALQALYEWYYTQNPSNDIIKHIIENLMEDRNTTNYKSINRNYFDKLVTGSISNIDTLDRLMQPHLDRSINSLNPIELAVLRLAIFELSRCFDVPYRVVINEALELTKRFGSEQGHRYVNAVLDALAPSLRKAEFKENRERRPITR